MPDVTKPVELLLGMISANESGMGFQNRKLTTPCVGDRNQGRGSRQMNELTSQKVADKSSRSLCVFEGFEQNFRAISKFERTSLRSNHMT